MPRGSDFDANISTIAMRHLAPGLQPIFILFSGMPDRAVIADSCGQTGEHDESGSISLPPYAYFTAWIRRSIGMRIRDSAIS
ncbi:hypothetical protein ACN22W_24800 [Burkholderia theae]|uniref:hypothetical protein n=1 Tax=Burkholderia theae TaxID=3143496 RepID=UPI003AFB50B6